MKAVRPRLAGLSAAALAMGAAIAPVATAQPSDAAPPPSCVGATATTAVPFEIPIVDWSENVGYDAQENMWVSRLNRNEVQRYDSAGTLTATVPVELPGAVRLGPDGLLYVVYGASPTSVVRPGGIVRFDPSAAAPEPEIFVSGLTMPNGAAFDARGDLYVATLSGVVKIRSEAPAEDAWEQFVAAPAASGVAAHDDMVYVTTNGGPLGRIVRIPISAPEEHSIVADLSAPVAGLPDFADDLLVDSEGIAYVTTLAGQLVRVDPATGTTCTIVYDQPMTAVATVPDQPNELVASTESGAILRIRLSR
ncbi:hypothetical protein [Nocardia sp. CNY236]|uniref:hypothetical protein n=1 Tax=Nocardia sp. CNY236 TaxID=1169152 RepID=UPI0003FC9641|nr:hypothetical protein [Nocardia sp. CNY236]